MLLLVALGYLAVTGGGPLILPRLTPASFSDFGPETI
jgi:hypothetical protein